MSLEEQSGVVERLTEKGFYLSGTHLAYSKWYKGDALIEANIGQKVTVLVDVYQGRPYLKRVKSFDEKIPNFVPPEPPKKGGFGGGGRDFRRLTPEEVKLKEQEGPRIGRSVSLEWASYAVEKGLDPLKVLVFAALYDPYVVMRDLPHGVRIRIQELLQEFVAPDPPSPPEAPGKPGGPSPKEEATKPAVRPVRPKRLSSQLVNALFNDARRGKVVSDWKDYESLVREVAKVEVKTPYHLSIDQFAEVESAVRARLVKPQAA